MFPLFVSTARIEEMKQSLLNQISELGKELPLNTLDELIDKFGGPDKVSEVHRVLHNQLETLHPVRFTCSSIVNTTCLFCCNNNVIFLCADDWS